MMIGKKAVYFTKTVHYGIWSFCDKKKEIDRISHFIALKDYCFDFEWHILKNIYSDNGYDCKSSLLHDATNEGITLSFI